VGYSTDNWGFKPTKKIGGILRSVMGISWGEAAISDTSWVFNQQYGDTGTIMGYTVDGCEILHQLVGG